MSMYSVHATHERNLYSTKELIKQRTFKLKYKNKSLDYFVFFYRNKITNFHSANLNEMSNKAFHFFLPMSIPLYQFMHNIEPDPHEETIFYEIDYKICGRRAERSSAQEGIQDTVSVTIALLMYTELMDKNKRNKQKFVSK